MNESKERHPIDLGHGHRMSWIDWNSDKELNPQWRDIAPIKHEGSVWQVVQEEPLTISPSLLCKRCGDHGFIQNGRWTPA